MKRFHLLADANRLAIRIAGELTTFSLIRLSAM